MEPSAFRTVVFDAFRLSFGKAEADKVMFHDIAVCATEAVCEDVKRVMRLFKPGV